MEGPRYRLVERLGQGGMATVWRAEDRQLGREVAVKVLLPLFADRPEAQERFFREAKALATIRHPNVLQLFDFLPADGEEPARLVMERLHGPSLQRFVVDAGAPLPELAALVGAEVAAGLVAVHGRGIVHRDVKPENVLLDEGRVVLTDFGVARVAATDQSALTQTGAIIGSPAYMSPEQARGDDVDARSDQFSLGSLIYWLASGRAPFSGSHPLVVMQKIDRVDTPPVDSFNPRVPAWLERVVRRCHARNPDDRFADAAALVAALRTGLSDDGLGEPAVELRAYFADPPAWNAALPGRVIPARLADATRAMAEGRRARALGSATRVLQLDPDHVAARSIVNRLTRRRSLGVVVAALAIATLLVGVPTALWLRPHPQPIVVAPVVTPVVAPVVVPTPEPARPQPIVATKPRARPVAKPATAIVPAVAPAPAVVIGPAPELPPAPSQLTVRTAPWCDLSIDGKVVGRTPQSTSLPAGTHRVQCDNPSGGRLDRTVELFAGTPRLLEARLDEGGLVTPRLVRGDAVAIDDDAPAATARHLPSGRHRVTLFRAGATLATRWIDVPNGGCTLLDDPEVRCERP